MSDERARRDTASAIDRRLSEALASLPAFALPAARETMEAFDDHWCGHLLRSCHDAMSGRERRTAVFAAATSVELLRGYCHQRRAVLGSGRTPERSLDHERGRASDVADEHGSADANGRSRGPAASRPTDGSTGDVGASVLAGDYLHATAYRVLGDIPADSYHACLETLTEVSATIAATLETERGDGVGSEPSAAFFAGTTGTLGEGAAVVAAELAGVDGDDRETVATLGHGVGVHRGITRSLDANTEAGSDASEQLSYAETQLEAARCACRSLVGSAADRGLESVVRTVELDAE